MCTQKAVTRESIDPRVMVVVCLPERYLRSASASCGV